MRFEILGHCVYILDVNLIYEFQTAFDMIATVEQIEKIFHKYNK